MGKAPVNLRRAALVSLVLLVSACAAASRTTSDDGPTMISSPAKLLVRLDTGNIFYKVGQHVADYLTDGTVIRLHDGKLETNKLTATGLATVQALLDRESDLLSGPGRFEPKLVRSALLFGPGTIGYHFILPAPDGSRFIVSSVNAWSPDAKNWVPDPAIDRLSALAGDLADPASLVGDTGLVDPAWLIYRPARMGVFLAIAPTRICGSDPNDNLDCLSVSPPAGTSGTDWLFPGDPRAFGTAFTFAGDTTRRCALLPGAEVDAAVANLPLSADLAQKARDSVAATLASGVTWESGYPFWPAGGPGFVIIVTVVALLPEDVAGPCADALRY